MQRIDELEVQQGKIESQLAMPEVYTDGERARDLLRDYDRVRGEIGALWDRLEEHEEKLARSREPKVD